MDRKSEQTTVKTNLAGAGLCGAVWRLGDGVVGLLSGDLSREPLSDGELGIDRAPGPTLAASVASVSVSDHASPAVRTDLGFLAAPSARRRRENALLSEHFS